MQIQGDEHAQTSIKHIKFFFSYLQNKTYMHKHKSFSPFMNKARKTCIYTKILLPLFVNHQQRGKVKQKQCSPSLCQKQKSTKVKSNQPIKRYMRYTFMKRKTLS